MVLPYEDKIGGNPIGLLQELCMSRRWPPPSYQTEHEEGLPHERQFTIACTVFKFKEIGKSMNQLYKIHNQLLGDTLANFMFLVNHIVGCSLTRPADISLYEMTLQSAGPVQSTS